MALVSRPPEQRQSEGSLAAGQTRMPGVAFSLVTFSWPDKRKWLAVQGETCRWGRGKRGGEARAAGWQPKI